MSSFVSENMLNESKCSATVEQPRGRTPVKFVEGMKYADRTCKMLRDELARRGMKKSGTKTELVERLKKDDTIDKNTEVEVDASHLSPPISPLTRQHSTKVPSPEELDLQCAVLSR